MGKTIQSRRIDRICADLARVVKQEADHGTALTALAVVSAAICDASAGRRKGQLPAIADSFVGMFQQLVQQRRKCDVH